MSLFQKKTATELRRDIQVLKRKETTEANRSKLESKRKALAARVRELKYAKVKAAVSSIKNVSDRVGRGALVVGSKVVNTVEKRGVPRPFSVAFPPGKMVAVPRAPSAGPTLSSKGSPARGFSTPKVSGPRFNPGASSAFNVRLRRSPR